MISWFIIAVSTARNWTVAAGDNRSLRSPTCVGYRPKEPNGALQLLVVPHNVLSPISAMPSYIMPTCSKRGYAVISTAHNYVTHLLCEQICPLAISWVQNTTKRVSPEHN